MVRLLDSTLREGEQTPGVCFPPHAKLAIASLLDRFGVGVIEAGHPAVCAGIEAAVRALAGRGFRAQIAAHARSLRSDVDKALDCGVDFLGVFFCVSSSRLEGVFRRSLATAIDQIADCIAYAKEGRPELTVRYTPEDTVRSPFENVVDAAAAAVEAGADIISIADTTGAMIPARRSLHDFVLRLREALASRGAEPLLAVHCHDDRGLALANALDAYRAGVDVIDVTVLGLGERAGLVDLATLATVLAADFGEEGWELSLLPRLYETVSTYCGVPVPVTAPVVGANAFTHCAGVHTHAATRNAVHYQSLDPALVGREMQVSLDHMSGLSSVQYAMEAIGEDPEDRELARRVLAEVKRVGEQGRSVRAGELADIVRWVRA
ncbi:MAG: 2-isopropylmalate synthase [Planctomycetota bacterium]|nr:MAG: 2-isopropylmalate synthase [Planctomycetota bacterium]